ncbi:carbohydrate-binding domain-containing protein [Clostridium sp. D53t1_180928_C8]|uniref:carbohydrate-binding domain-containing protein n=1 Tax=Clostridium sp. D53t1_180928_C8 TaxID=2787101 RepID=UPI0018A95B01|nr:carbohydrate-binding domain-containing protein [Clostridium sp. D53t1_180928_C8]
MKKKFIIALTVATLCFSSVSCSKTTTDSTNDTVIESTTTNDNSDSTNKNVDEEMGGITASISLDNTISINGNGATVNNNVVTINNGGTYSITGTSSNAQIIIDSASEENVYLILNNVNLTCSNSAPIYVKSAKNAIIVLPDGTENTINDSKIYTFEDTSTDEPNAAIFSKDDLTIKGTGSLNVNANYNNGITSKDDLKITGGNISVTSSDDGLMGKDSITIKGGNITINASGDGLKSTNTEDTSKGYVSIEGGTLNITSENDGIQAETNVNITDGTINITSGGGSANSSTNTDNMQSPWGQWENSNTSSSTDTSSAKAIKAVNTITIDAGNFNIDSSDDSLHSNNSLVINGGIFEISSGDDGIHSDTTLEINGGDINITKSYEGIESTDITINNGTIHLVASDDGLNAAGGNDSSSTNGRPGQNNFSSSSDGTITINGGYIYINASGDGIDANGSIEMNEGTVIVNGPENNGNGALDYDSTCNINGGVFIAAGSSGMAQSPSTSSRQNFVNIFTSSQSANTLISIKNENGEDIVTFAPSKTYQSVIISSPNLQSRTNYIVYSGCTSNGESTDGLYISGSSTGGSEVGNFTTSSISSTVGSGGNNNMPGNMGGNSGNKRPRN